MRRLPGKLHIGSKFPLENLPHEDHHLAFTTVAQAVTHQRLMQRRRQLGSEIADQVGVTENHETRLLLLDNLPERVHVAVRRIVGEQGGIDAQHFLELEAASSEARGATLWPKRTAETDPPSC